MSPIGPKIDLKGDPIFESAAWFVVIILKFIVTSIFEVKIHEKNFLTPKKFYFRRPIQDTDNFEISGNLMANGIELCNDVFWLILDVEKNLDLTSRALNYDIP